MNNNVPALREKIEQAVNLINQSEKIVFFTGAGISTPSGIPDFRSQGSGLWNRFNPMSVASLTTFRHNPEDFFEWLHPLVSGIIYAKPNKAHEAISDLENFCNIEAVITQNIDTFHQKAGSSNVIEVHGSLGQYHCLHCGKRIQGNDQILLDFIENKEIPRCKNCHQILKPDITLYEEMLPATAWQKAVQASEGCDLFIAVGTSLEVTPANQLPKIAIANDAALIINTISSTFMDRRADLLLPYDVEIVWSEIIDKIRTLHDQ